MFKTALITNYIVRLPSQDLGSIIDNNKEKYCAQNNNKCSFKYLTLFPITQTNFETLR